ncbi:hypothetical protein N7466_005994 [Penicillium verhagenii]|uniref:uncharacterized protein n=1 Tax=Penicillium verhagenii TaxID=1562060 RepID=UPI0025457272|nr:uncharacterized protein N7466_005994 [Penicillium verhagenii]KAJ5930501.1 hypothetical protein N7466_005994 [Penicillium verhagenii]
MKAGLFTSVLALASSAFAAPSVGIKRSPSGAFELIAYGVASEYITMFYSDGLAYAGDSSLWTSGNVTTDITFLFSDNELAATATTSGVTLDSDTLLYVRPTADEVLPVGFTGNGYTTPSDASSDSFIWYGSYLMWEGTGGTLSDVFRLKETSVSGVYQFYWDTSSLDPSGYLIPTIKDLLV